MPREFKKLSVKAYSEIFNSIIDYAVAFENKVSAHVKHLDVEKLQAAEQMLSANGQKLHEILNTLYQEIPCRCRLNKDVDAASVINNAGCELHRGWLTPAPNSEGNFIYPDGWMLNDAGGENFYFESEAQSERKRR